MIEHRVTYQPLEIGNLLKMKLPSFVVVCLVALVGCGGGGTALKVVPVAGVVRYKDAPVADADLVFYPEKGPAAMAKTDSTGAFQLKTNGQLGGSVGKNKVTVLSKQADAIPPSDGRAMEFANKSTFPKKYSSEADTDLIIDIPANGNKELKLDLTD